MRKSSFFTGQPIFNQLLCLIPRSLVSRLARQYQTDRYCKTFRSFDHLVTMLYSTLHQCNSLREVVTGMQACASRLRHLGLSVTPRRSTLADANERRNSQLFEELYYQIYKRYYGGLPDSLKAKRWIDKLFIIDSTIISLFSAVMKSTGSYGCNGKKKGGIKAHVLLRAKDDLPCFIRLTEGKAADSSFLPSLRLPAGSIVVMDKGYRNFQQFIKWSRQHITWVTRLHARTVYTTTHCRPLEAAEQQQGVLQDQLIELGNPETANINAVQKARLIVFYDQVTKREFQFVTNNTELEASTIAAIYKKRWQIELVFKRIKQNFQLHSFLGDNENAIRIQVWSAFIADLLLKIIKDRADKKRKWSMANLASLIRLHLGTYINLLEFLCNPDKSLLNYQPQQSEQQTKLFPLSIRGA